MLLVVVVKSARCEGPLQCALEILEALLQIMVVLQLLEALGAIYLKPTLPQWMHHLWGCDLFEGDGAAVKV